jgi:fluoride ion exporter CrcB/FEX
MNDEGEDFLTGVLAVMVVGGFLIGLLAQLAAAARW